MFFERHLENILKFYIPDTTNPNEVLDLIPLCKEYVKKLEIDQFLPPVKEDVSDTESDAGIDEPSMDHFDLSLLLPVLPHLEELHLSYGVKDCGMNFEWNLFEFTYRDCCSLANAIKKCPTLKDGGKQLLEGMSDNKTVVEFDLRLAEVGQESEYLINQTIKANQELARLRNLHLHHVTWTK
uniref:T-complex-associated-testis-expressed 1 n=1 Tax=Pseudonaja textilis TaxID=8673 RepID=A0A670YFX7_PSETE